MRKLASYTVALLVIALLLAVRFYPQVERWLGRDQQAVIPVSASGGAALDGPYFSNGGRIAERVVAAINRTQKTLDIAMYDLTEPSIAGAIEAARRRGVEVRIVADEHQSGEAHSEIPYLQSRGVPVRRSRGYRGNRSIMHDKFAVFDRRLVETGSFNWTTSADAYNFENAIFISSPEVVSRYEDEFDGIWGQAR